MSKVVFVGNVPYNMGEDALIDVFKSVGQVVGFRLVFDRDTGKPKGYGFCEFADHETALSAVRNLNDTDVGGRPLRIDLADSDPFLEGKTTVRGELLDSGAPGPAEPRSHWQRTESRGPEGSEILAAVPPGKSLAPGEDSQEAITRIIAQVMSESELIEVLAQMKAFVITHPKQAQQLLLRHPQVAYAVFMGLITTRIIPADLLHRMVEAQGNRLTAMPAQHFPPPPQQQQHFPPPHAQLHPQHQPYPLPPSRLQQQPPQPMQGMMSSGPGMASPYGLPSMPPPQGMPPMPPYYRGPPPGPPQMPMAPQQHPMPQHQPPPQMQHQLPPTAQQPPLLQQMLKGDASSGAGAGAGDNKDALYALVMNLTPAQLNELPPSERVTIESLRNVLLTNPEAMRG